MRLDHLKLLNEARAARRPIALVTDVADGTQRVVAAEAIDEDPLGAIIAERMRIGKGALVQHDGRDVFVAVQVPPSACSRSVPCTSRRRWRRWRRSPIST